MNATLTNHVAPAPADRYSGGNALLDLFGDDLERVAAAIEVLPYGSGALLYPGHAERDFDYAYFPLDAIASMIATMNDGSAAEAGTAGREGMVGLALALGASRAYERWIVQIPGRVARIDVASFRELVADPNGRPARVIARYVQGFITSLSQSAACNRLHLLDERCARWLLMTHDRVGRDEFFITHEFLALMLGVRRSGVSIAASKLQDEGAISYVRGRARVRDREALERKSCECYRVIDGELQRLLADFR
jgi:CRP-like cAMP-binding protein